MGDGKHPGAGPGTPDAASLPPAPRSARVPPRTSHPRPAEERNELCGVGPAALSNLGPRRPAPPPSAECAGDARAPVPAARPGGAVTWRASAPPASAGRGTGACASEAPAGSGLGLPRRRGEPGPPPPAQAGGHGRRRARCGSASRVRVLGRPARRTLGAAGRPPLSLPFVCALCVCPGFGALLKKFVGRAQPQNYGDVAHSEVMVTGADQAVPQLVLESPGNLECARPQAGALADVMSFQDFPRLIPGRGEVWEPPAQIPAPDSRTLSLPSFAQYLSCLASVSTTARR